MKLDNLLDEIQHLTNYDNAKSITELGEAFQANIVAQNLIMNMVGYELGFEHDALLKEVLMQLVMASVSLAITAGYDKKEVDDAFEVAWNKLSAAAEKMDAEGYKNPLATKMH